MCLSESVVLTKKIQLKIDSLCHITLHDRSYNCTSLLNVWFESGKASFVLVDNAIIFFLVGFARTESIGTGGHSTGSGMFTVILNL